LASLAAIFVVSDAALGAGVRRSAVDLPVRVLVDEPSFLDWDEFSARVEMLAPDVLVLEYAALRAPIEETMKRLQQMRKAPAVIIVHTETQADVILRVIRAGAMEYCYAPVEQPLRVALEKLLAKKAETASARGCGRTYGFLSAKGGCGATTVSCHVAVSLQYAVSDRILLADFDMGGALIDFLLKSKPAHTVAQAIVNLHRLDESYWKALVTAGGENLDVLTGSLVGALGEPLPVERLAGVLQFARTLYPHTIVDLGRFISPAALAAVRELDRTYLVTTLDVLALHQARKVIELLLNAGYGRDRVGLVVNRVTGHRDIDPADVEKLLGVPVTSVLPDDTGALHDAYPEGKLLAPESRLYLHLARLARRVTGLPEEQQKKKFLFFGAK
jgi:pilus assembly protein CpaE